MFDRDTNLGVLWTLSREYHRIPFLTKLLVAAKKKEEEEQNTTLNLIIGRTNIGFLTFLVLFSGGLRLNNSP